MLNKLRIIFMGTPDFAVPSLESLISNGYDIAAVITAPDKPKGRGRKVTPSPVKACAQRHHIPVLQPSNLKAQEFLTELKRLRANLQIVVAFRMLPEVVWSAPALGTFNLHASLLPQYRGAAPINWVIINGEEETGVTTFFLRHDIDTGDIIFQEHEPILVSDTAGTLHDRLMEKGAQLVLRTAQAIERGDCPSMPQPVSTALKRAPKLRRDDGEIRWTHAASAVINLVRGLSPYPGAWTTIGHKTFKIFAASLAVRDDSAEPGTCYTDNKQSLFIRASDRWISIDELQAEGGRRMKTSAFLAGHTLRSS